MSLKPQSIPAIPEMTVQVAHAAFRKGNPYMQIESDIDAVNSAILPGISGKPISKSARLDDPWANSGFGLYMLSRLCSLGGSFFIISGQAGLLLSQGRQQVVEAHCLGTAVRLVLDTQNIGRLSDALYTFGKEGSEISATTKPS